MRISNPVKDIMQLPEDVTLPGVSRAIEGLDVDVLRDAIRTEYASVAADPAQGFHFHTGRRLTRMLGYDDAWLDDVPEDSIASFAGTGNPFSLGVLHRGENVVDVGCGAGIDSLIAARMVGPTGNVLGVDMTPAMLARARASADRGAFSNVRFHEGLAESIPVADGWADVLISNGVLNLFPDKFAGLQEMARVLKPGGRLQVGDILVEKPLGDKAKRNIDLWKG
jgi:arsenite methyltransferase